MGLVPDASYDVATLVAQKDVGTAVITLWCVFLGSVALLSAGSNLCCRQGEGLTSVSAALRGCGLWISAGAAFNCFIIGYLGYEAAESWFLGYVLEYTLSFDNLFLFHVIFSSYRTPATHVYRGITTAMRCGLFSRFWLFFIGAGVFNLTFVFRWIFGALLLYTGVKVMVVNEEESDPTDNCMVRMVSKRLPIHDQDVAGAAFFVPRTDASTSPAAHPPEMQKATDSRFWCWRQCKATPLLLAVLTLLIVDALFAVDSVTAKVSMISQYDDRIDLFINFSSTAFAMLCMPSLYFIISLMANLFRLLKYGLGIILVLIGLKLLTSEHIKVREDVSCLVMMSILAMSVMLSMMLPRQEQLGVEIAQLHLGVELPDASPKVPEANMIGPAAA